MSFFKNLTSWEVEIYGMLAVMLLIIPLWFYLFFKKTPQSQRPWAILFSTFLFCALLFYRIYLIVNWSIEKATFEEAQIEDLAVFSSANKEFIIIVQTKTIQSEDGTTYYWVLETLDSQNGKRVIRQAIPVNDFSFSAFWGANNEYLLLRSYSKLLIINPLKDKGFEPDTTLIKEIESQNPDLKGNIAKLEFDNYYQSFYAISKKGDKKCLSLQSFKAIDCQDWAKSENQARKFLHYGNYFEYQDYQAFRKENNTWVVFAPAEINQRGVFGIYIREKKPQYPNITVQLSPRKDTNQQSSTKEDSSILTNNIPLDRTYFYQAKALMYQNEQLFIQEKAQNDSSKTVLKAFHLSKKQVRWQINLDSLKMENSPQPNYDIRFAQKGKILLLFTKKQDSEYQGVKKIFALDTETGKIQWEFDFRK
jgi:hypothetical protein